jgi:membrane-bound inhibitor of C-type lysozyme
MLEPPVTHMSRNMKKSILVVSLIALFAAGIFFVFRVNTDIPRAIGGQKDAHGCLPGAGYSWCEAKHSCIRVWETSCTAAPAKKFLFTCDKGQTIDATFYPTDDKFVDLVLSDSRAMKVPLAISASGARYANADESFVFWNKGNTAFITESGTTTYSGCVTND